MDPASLRPLAVWEGAVASRRRQFCVVFFAADATCGGAGECTMQLQMKEVAAPAPPPHAHARHISLRT